MTDLARWTFFFYTRDTAGNWDECYGLRMRLSIQVSVLPRFCNVGNPAKTASHSLVRQESSAKRQQAQETRLRKVRMNSVSRFLPTLKIEEGRGSALLRLNSDCGLQPIR